MFRKHIINKLEKLGSTTCYGFQKKLQKKKTKQMSVGTDGDGVSWQSYSYHHIYYFGVSEPTSENGEKRRCFLHVWNFVLGDKKLNIKMKK
jgi:hypothetical protein